MAVLAPAQALAVVLVVVDATHRAIIIVTARVRTLVVTLAVAVAAPIATDVKGNDKR